MYNIDLNNTMRKFAAIQENSKYYLSYIIRVSK